MPVFFQNSTSVIERDAAQKLWAETCAHTNHPDEEVTVRWVDEEESRRLNNEYRKKDAPTNVLTFNYGEGPEGHGEHDIALCLDVVKTEAAERTMPTRDYCALVLVHAFLHAVGVDHEASETESARMQEMERTILQKAGFPATHL